MSELADCVCRVGDLLSADVQMEHESSMLLSQLISQVGREMRKRGVYGEGVHCEPARRLYMQGGRFS